MKNTLVFAVLFALSAPAFAADNIVTARCGVEGRGVVLEIAIDKGDEQEFVSPKILTVNGSKPCAVDGIESAAFGRSCYDSVKLELDVSSCKGSATYSQYVGGFAGTKDVALKCVCKK